MNVQGSSEHPGFQVMCSLVDITQYSTLSRLPWTVLGYLLPRECRNPCRAGSRGQGMQRLGLGRALGVMIFGVGWPRGTRARVRVRALAKAVVLGLRLLWTKQDNRS